MEYSNAESSRTHRITNPRKEVEGTMGDYWSGFSAVPQNAFPRLYAPHNTLLHPYVPVRTSPYLHAERLPWTSQSTTRIAPVQRPAMPAPYTPLSADDLPRVPTRAKGRGVYDRNGPRTSTAGNPSNSSSKHPAFEALEKKNARTRKSAETKKRKRDEENDKLHTPQRVPRMDGQGFGQGYRMGDGGVTFAGNSMVTINNHYSNNYMVANNGHPLYTSGRQVNTNHPIFDGFVGRDLRSYNQPSAIYGPMNEPAYPITRKSGEWNTPATYQNVHIQHAYEGGGYDNTGMGNSTVHDHPSSYGQPPALQSSARMPDELYNILEGGAIPFPNRLEQQSEVPALLSNIDPVLLNSTETPVEDLPSSATDMPALSAPAADEWISPLSSQEESVQMAPLAKRRCGVDVSVSADGGYGESAPIEEGKDGVAELDALFEEFESGA